MVQKHLYIKIVYVGGDGATQVSWSPFPHRHGGG